MSDLVTALKELEAVAERATPGPWDGRYVYEAVRHIARNCDYISGDDSEFGWDRYNDSPYITAMNPTVGRALIAVAKAAQEHITGVRDEEFLMTTEEQMIATALTSLADVLAKETTTP